MVDKVLLDNVNRLGLTLMETEAAFDANKTLADVVKNKDMRLWEGFPVLLANAGQEYLVDYDQVVKHLTRKKDKENFHKLVSLSLAVYQFFRLSFVWSRDLKKKFSKKELAYLEEAGKGLAHDKAVSVSSKKVDPQRLKQTFMSYFERDAKKTMQMKQKYEDLSLEYALSQLFSPRQKELFKKKLNNEAFTKTEREYYSRTVKKKVAALSNPELHRLAQQLMTY